MDDDLYDEFGNLIGDPNDSDAESSQDEEPVQIPSLQDFSDDEGDKRMTDESQIVLLEDKQHYLSLSETFGADVETIIQTQDTQDINEPIIKPLERQTFQLEELELPQTTYAKDYMIQISKVPERVRNVALTGDLHSGKTSFIDMLILQTHPNLKFNGDNLRYTDNHKLENSKGLTLKTVPMSLLLPNLKSKSIVVNVLDTPGHVNFLDEVSVAQATTDSTIICIDVVQGLSRMDKLIIDSCLHKNISMSFILNKIDRLILELRLPPLDSYFKLKSTLNEINSYISSKKTGSYTYQSVISPDLGNVCFASSKYQFCFNLKSFIVTNYGDQVDIDSFSARLWGDVFYENSLFTTKPVNKLESSQNRSFIKFILEPLYKIFNNTLTKSDKQLQKFLETNFKLKIDKSYYKLDPQSLLKTVLQQIFKNSIGFVDMLENATPSPLSSFDKKIKEFELTNDTIKDLVAKCDPEAPLIAHITKLIDTVDSKRFYGLVKVISGSLNLSTNSYKVLGENYLDDDEDIIEHEKFTKLYLNGARYKIPVGSITAGNIGLIMSDNLDSFITKTGTIYSQDLPLEMTKIFKPLDYLIYPVFKIAVEPKAPSDLHKLLEGFRKINRSYVGSEIKVEESGEHVILGSGELYLDCLLHDLRYLYTDIEIKVSDPLTKFAETCGSSTMTKLPIKSSNGLNEVCIIIEPLELQVLQDIENELIPSGPQNSRKLAKWFRENYQWDSLAARSVWSFGSSNKYPNVLIDDTLPDEVDKLQLSSLKNFIIQGFQWATREGPLCDEPIRNLKFKIMSIKLSQDMVDCNGGQIIPMIRNACYAAMLITTPRLLEPVYNLHIVVKLSSDQDPKQLISGLSDMLSKRRGHVIESHPIPLTPLYRIDATVPVLDSVGLETDIRLRTQGQAMCFLSFDSWGTVPGDPLDKYLYLPNLKPVPYKSLARDCVLKTRRRKGLNGEPGLNSYIDDAELLQDLKDAGIIDE